MKRLTRRSFLHAAAAASVVGLRPWSAATAEAAVPGYLRRSTYLWARRRGYSARVGGRGVPLQLISAKGRENAFSLTFAGPLGRPLVSGIHTLRHPALGTFQLFLSPVGVPQSGRHRYEAVVDRRMSVATARRRAPRRRRRGTTR
jgi:hypothetical protein